ncbi:amino acid ABC transporter substrate-binding protein [Streptomyces sp. A1547]|uniref:ABC transporter substrate-binding protein n=1 Tax=Streptomyces sp. A1547 TaxID=2563105 RepID=UPI00109ECAB3|nr:amino acid ABC transporter substrate-binding protein [Streptomyces sp. A1547]THA40287.1 amino acid ABC transporter substrate-binding protein [Streptomyces sp. A1547]
MPAGVRNPRLGRLRRHPVLSLTAALLLLAGAVLGGTWGYGVLFPPALSCGPGMTAAGTPLACVGVNLDSRPFTKGEPARMRKLEDTIRAANEAVQGNSISVVLMLNLSPIDDVDTLTYESLYHNIEGAMAAVWRANNTAAYGSTPGVKLYLANMGSQYGSWQQAVASVKKNAAAEHISAVVGLGQSTEQTRQAAAAISAQLHIPVIGSTVTGNSMNLDPADPAGKRTIPDMFRVSPTNSDSVIAANQYVSGLRPAVTSLAVVADSVADDDYTATLAAEAKTRFQAPDRTVTVLPYTSPRSLPSGAGRQDYLIQQFNLMHANLCQAAPSVVYFAGRGRDLGAFVQNWVQGAPCGIPQLRILVGDDASAAIRDDAVLKGLASGRVTVTYTALASPDEWGTECPGSDAKRNYDQFWSAFTGRPDPCTKQPLATLSGAAPLAFDPADLASGQAMLSHDAAVAAISAARHDEAGVKNPGLETGILHQFYCAQMLPGASGWLSFGADGNPVGKPAPIVQLNADGTTKTVTLTWPSSAPNLSLPQRGGTGAPGC